MTKLIGYIFILAAISYGLFNCTNSKGMKASRECSIDTLDSHVVFITDKMIRFNPTAQVFRQNGSYDAIITYNQLSNALQFTDLFRDTTYHKILFLKSEGDQAINNVKSIYYHNRDSIFLFSLFYIYLINDLGEIKFKIPINRELSPVKGIDFSQRALNANYDCPMYYNSVENSLYLNVYNFNHNISQTEYYEGSIAAKLNLGNLTVQELPIYYPKDFLQHRFGTLTKPNITFGDKRIIYSFQYSSDIYIFDKKTMKISNIDCPSNYSLNEAQPMASTNDFDLITAQKYNSTNPLYFRMTFDNQQKIWYRTNFSENFVKYNGQYAKNEVYLSAWDENFNKIDEVRISWDYLPFVLFPTSQGLLMFNASQSESSNENRVIYKIIRIRCGKNRKLYSN